MSTNPVFDLTYDEKRTTADQKWFVPDILDVLPSSACSYKASSKAVHGASSYFDSLEVDATVSGGAFGFAFSASTDYQKVKQGTAQSDTVYTSSTALCSVYHSKVKPFTKLKLSDDFINGVNSLPAEMDKNPYALFTQTFGTHYVKEIGMGGKSTRFSSFTSSAYSNMTSSGIDVTAAASADFGIVHGSASAAVGKHGKAAQQLAKQAYHQGHLCIPATCPPIYNASSGRDPLDDNSLWTQQVASDPYPMSYSGLTSLDDLLTVDYFPNTTQADMLKKQLNLFTYLREEYCGDVPNCAPPNPLGYWSKEPIAPAHRVAAAAVAVGSTMYYLGGFDSVTNGPSPLVQAFTSSADTISWTSAAVSPLPTARHNLTASMSGNLIYAIGGQKSYCEGYPLTTVEVLDPRRNKWSSKKPMPTARYSLASATLDDGSILAIGGRSSQGVSSAVESYSADNDVWKNMSNMTVAREGLCAGLIHGVVYVAGGFDGTSFVATLEALNPSTGKWVKNPVFWTAG